MAQNIKRQKAEMYSLDSEQAVLGALLIKNDCFDEVSAIIQAEDFYTAHHQIIFRTISSLLNKGKAADILTVEQKLKEVKNFGEENTGILGYIAELAKNTPSAANVKAYAELIIDYSRRRRLHYLGQYIIDNTKKHCSEAEFDHILAESEKSLFDISVNQIQDNQPVDLSQAMDKVLHRIELACKNKDPVVGAPSGFKKLDLMTTGFQPAEMIILAARPSMGKTACALTMAYNALEIRPDPVHVYSMEMPADKIMERMMSLVSSISANIIKNPLDADDEDMMKIGEAISYIQKNWTERLILDDDSRLTPHRLRTKIRRNIRLYGKPSVIFVDYLQIMTMPGKINKYEEVTAISAEIKAISKEIAVPIVVLAQLSRGPENRADKRPVLSDLRDSGAIEQDADLILLLHRDDYYARPHDTLTGLSEIIVAKHRNGPLGSVVCRFEGEYSRFTALNDAELSAEYEDPQQKALSLLGE